MRVRMFPFDAATAVGAYRMFYPSQAAEGADVDYVFEGPLFYGKYPDRDEWHAWPDDPQADVVVVQVPINPRLLDYIPRWQAQGVAVVAEIDDDVTQHCAYHVNAMPGVMKAQVVKDVCEMADLVTCSTPALAKIFAPHGRSRVLPNCVPEWYLNAPRSEREDDRPVLGWAGAARDRQDDLRVVRSGALHALLASGGRFQMIGPGDYVRENLRLEIVPYDATGTLTHIEYIQALDRLDVGMVPLALTTFNDSKSYVKGLEFASRGVPFVASPSSAYVDLARWSIGDLAYNPTEWFLLLRGLLMTPHYRSQVAEQARELVRNHHTYEVNGWKWTEAWDDAMMFRRASSAWKDANRFRPIRATVE